MNLTHEEMAILHAEPIPPEKEREERGKWERPKRTCGTCRFFQRDRRTREYGYCTRTRGYIREDSPACRLYQRDMGQITAWAEEIDIPETPRW